MNLVIIKSVLKVSVVSTLLFSNYANANSKIESMKKTLEHLTNRQDSLRGNFEEIFNSMDSGEVLKPLSAEAKHRIRTLNTKTEKEIIFDVPMTRSLEMNDVDEINEAMFFHKLDLDSEDHMHIILGKFAEVQKNSSRELKSFFSHFLQKFINEGSGSKFTNKNLPDFIASFASITNKKHDLYKISFEPATLVDHLLFPLDNKDIIHLIAKSKYATITDSYSPIANILYNSSLSQIYKGGPIAFKNWTKAHVVMSDTTSAIRKLSTFILKSTSSLSDNLTLKQSRIMEDVFEAAKEDDFFAAILEEAFKVIDEGLS